MRVCREPGCPTLVPADAYRTLCPVHARDRDKERGGREARGYGSAHRRLRAQWAARIARGEAPICRRCHRPVLRGQPWHLGHTDDRRGYHGPEHDACNLAAAGRASHMSDLTRTPDPSPSGAPDMSDS